MNNIRSSHLARYLRILIAFVLSAVAFGPTEIQAKTSANPANTPWPMYQHDLAHTGQSSYRGISHPPVLLWKQLAANCDGESGGISIGKSGELYLSNGGCVSRFDSTTRQTIWMSDYGYESRSIPTVREDGSLVWGFADAFVAVQSNGQLEWMIDGLSLNYIFGSSPAVDQDGNLYFSHDGMWSFTSDGDFRWVYFYDGFAHSSPAIGTDGTIYGSGDGWLYAFNPDGSVKFIATAPPGGTYESPTIGEDGTIYATANNCRLFAFNPDGTTKWQYRTEESYKFHDCGLNRGIAIGPSGMLYFSVFTGSQDHTHVYALNPDGSLKWKIPMYPKEVAGVSWSAAVLAPIVVDEEENVYVCAHNDTCYGISANREVLWEYFFPAVNGLPVWVDTAPVIAQDGVMYLLDSQYNLYAFGDPTRIPVLVANPAQIFLEVDRDTMFITNTIAITSTLNPITYTATMDAQSWITFTQSGSTTPGTITLQIKTDEIQNLSSTTTLSLVPQGILSNLLDIPITVDIATKDLFLPMVITP